MAGRCAAELSSPEFGSDSTQCAARKRRVLFRALASHALFFGSFFHPLISKKSISYTVYIMHNILYSFHICVNTCIHSLHLDWISILWILWYLLIFEYLWSNLEQNLGFAGFSLTARGASPPWPTQPWISAKLWSHFLKFRVSSFGLNFVMLCVYSPFQSRQDITRCKLAQQHASTGCLLNPCWTLVRCHIWLFIGYVTRPRSNWMESLSLPKAFLCFESVFSACQAFATPEALPECAAFRTRHRADVAFIVTMAGRIIQM